MNNFFWLHYRRRLQDESLHLLADTEQDEFQIGYHLEEELISSQHYLPRELVREEVTWEIHEPGIDAYDEQNWIEVIKAPKKLGAGEKTISSTQDSEAILEPNEPLPNPPAQRRIPLAPFLESK